MPFSVLADGKQRLAVILGLFFCYTWVAGVQQFMA
jgi:hypothetical protein